MYTRNERIRLKNSDGTNSTVLAPVTYTKAPEVKKKKSAEKEVKIVTEILDKDDQLNLIASLIEEYLDSVGYESDMYTYAKSKFANIRNVLANGA